MKATHFTPEQFVPAEIYGYIGMGRVPAKIKMKPEDFVVEERQNASRICSIGTSFDPELSFEEVSGKPHLVSVVLVKKRLPTFDAVRRVAAELGIPKHRVTFAGLKDRWAVTAQHLVIDLSGTNLTIADVRRACCPREINGTGWFIKDAVPASSLLSKGQLLSNRFTLNVQVPGLTAAQIDEYVQPRLKMLESKGWVIPNAYGRQRLGRRQNLHLIGQTLIEDGAEAAIKRFLTETAPGVERDAATKIRQQMADQWYWFQNMKEILERPLDNGRPAYECLNMSTEHEVVLKLIELGSFEAVMLAMHDDIFSLMVGAYQSFWFNQALAKAMRGEIPLPADGSIPLLVFDKEWDSKRRRETDNDGEALSFYKQYCPEAVPSRVDAAVRKHFLTPRRNHRGQANAPWRKAMIPVVDLLHSADNGIWHCKFELRSGAYATTLLGLMFDLDDDDKETQKRGDVRPFNRGGQQRHFAGDSRRR